MINWEPLTWLLCRKQLKKYDDKTLPFPLLIKAIPKVTSKLTTQLEASNFFRTIQA